MPRFNTFFSPKNCKVNVFESLDYDTIVTDSTDYVPTKQLIDKFIRGEKIMVPKDETYDYHEGDDIDDVPDDYTQSDDIDLADIPVIAEELGEKISKAQKASKRPESDSSQDKSSSNKDLPDDSKDGIVE